MSTIASLLGMIGQEQPRPWDIAQRSQNQAQTGLLELADLKRKQASEQEFMLAIQRDPALREQLFGGSTLGSPALLQQPPGGPPGGGPMTQQSVMPGQPPGAPQMVPGGQDLSQFATQGGPPQSTIASLGQAPPGQGAGGGGSPSFLTPSLPSQAPQNPALEMARTNPRAAMLIQQQMQTQLTTQLTMREKTAEAFAKTLQGVNSQESYESAVQDLMQWAPQQASRLPKVWSKEAMQPIIDSAISAKDKATLQIAEMKEQIDFRKQLFTERQAASSIPEYVKGEGPLNAWIDTLMQRAGIPRGTTPPADILEQAQKNVQEGKIAVSALQGTGQIVKGPTGEYIRVKPGTNQAEVIKGPGGEPLREKPSEAEQKGATLANSVAAANTLATELEDKGYKPSVWEKGIDKLPLGLGNYVTSSDYQKYRQTVREFASAWLYGVSGAQITASEWENANQTFFPQPNEDKGAVELKRQRRAALVEQLRQQSQATGRTGSQGQPTSQGSTGTGKPVSQMNAEETRAEIAAIKARGGR